MQRNSVAKKSHSCPPQALPRLSRQQQTVLNGLNQQPHPISAQRLHGFLKQQHSIGLATVYRTLETLKLRGLVQSRAGVQGESLYSSVEQDRHYLTCLRCGQSLVLDVCPVGELQTQLQRTFPFKIYYHTLEFFGLCSLCKLQTSKNPS